MRGLIFLYKILRIIGAAKAVGELLPLRALHTPEAHSHRGLALLPE